MEQVLDAIEERDTSSTGNAEKSQVRMCTHFHCAINWNSREDVALG